MIDKNMFAKKSLFINFVKKKKIQRISKQKIENKFWFFYTQNWIRIFRA